MTQRVQDLFDLSGQVALITGGSRGLGLQIAESLGEAGATIMLTARKAADLEEAVAHLQARGITAHSIASDAADETQAVAVVTQTVALLGHIDILVNNAGASWGAPAEDHPLAAWDKVMNLNIRSLFVFAQAVAKQSMLARRQGRIINVASIAGLAGNSNVMQTIAYNTSKGAVVNFTRALAGEWGPFGITVNALAPGFFPSKMTQGLLAAVGEDTLAASAPLRRIGDDEDLKGAALLFASRAGKHITGQILAVDGGVSAIHGA
ncbi:MAG: SDR family oxidoreductase [Paucibacter sp.]|nr:SDR family oxidoreductase [Roseateles sp.]